MKKEYQMPSLKEAQLRSRKPQEISYDSFVIPDEISGFGKDKYYYLRTYGCQANVRDSETIAGILELLGYKEADSLESSDFILLNTCAIRENAEDKVFGELGSLKRMKRNNPDLIIGVCGCMAQEEVVVKRILETYPQVDLVFGTHNIHNLPNLLHQAVFSREKTIEIYSKEGEIIENLPTRRFGNHKAWVNIMYGCDKFCTYCIVPYTRGKERSRLPEDILKEVVELKKLGYQEVTLLGQNVNAYGKDLEPPYNIAKLLGEVAEVGIPRIRFTTSHPWDFTEELVNVIAKYPNIMPAFHLPVQSGNNDVLKKMGRRYTVEEYKHIFDLLRKKIPDCTFTTDIIVGFPNETETQFQDTLALYDYCEFDSAYTFAFSARVGTPAEKMGDTVPLEEKKERLQRLNKSVAKYSLKSNRKYLDKEVLVLVDGPSKKDPNIFSGYTEHNKLVNFIPKKAKIGDIVLVKITQVKSWSLDGEEIEY